MTTNRQRGTMVLLSVLITAATSIMVAAHAEAATSAADRQEQQRYARETMNLRNDQFMARKADFLASGCQSTAGCTKPGPYRDFDWTSDSCSGPLPTGWRNLFNPACQEHDFGYRNFGKGLTLGRDEDTRKWIDDRFETEMKGICNYRFSDWTQYANLQTCFKEADLMHAVVRVASDWSNGTTTTTTTAADPAVLPAPAVPAKFVETVGGLTHTWTDYSSAGGDAGPAIPAGTSVETACRVAGFTVPDGDNWWYKIATSPWNGIFYSSADAFYNNDQTSGSLHGTPLVDERVPVC